MDIFCINGRCPICDAKVIKISTSDSSDIVCPNKCYVFVEYEIDSSESIYTFKIFGVGIAEFSTLNTKDTKDIEKYKIYSNINHWKENDRYLIKLMEV